MRRFSRRISVCLFVAGTVLFESESRNLVERDIAGVKTIFHDDRGDDGRSGGVWMLTMPDGCTNSYLVNIVDTLPTGIRHLHSGSPDRGGVCMLVLQANINQLETLLYSHSWPAHTILESDGIMRIIPEINSTRGSHSTLADPRPHPRQTGSENVQQDPISWGLDRIDSRLGLDAIYRTPHHFTGAGVHVYVLDTGIRTTHQDFGGRAIPTLEIGEGGMKVCDPSTPECALDLHGHGTHCAGTVGGAEFGVAKGATIHAVKCLDDAGSGFWSWFTVGIDWIVANGHKPAVLTASLSGAGLVPSVAVAIEAAAAAGFPLVVAAGNDNSNACEFTPSGVEEAITVGATDYPNNDVDRRSYFSNYGPCLDLFAPGASISSPGIWSDNAIAEKTGTSMAGPHVAGAVALLLEQWPNLGIHMLKTFLEMRATPGIVVDAKLSSKNRLLYIGSDPAPVQPEPEPTPTPTPVPVPGDVWIVLSGDCTIDHSTNCVTSPNFPSAYNFDHKCEIAVGNNIGAISATEFNTEWDYDFISINGVYYSGGMDAAPINVIPTTPITWTADTFVTGTGWKLCRVEAWTTVPGVYCDRDWTENWLSHTVEDSRACAERCRANPGCVAYTMADLSHDNLGDSNCVLCTGTSTVAAFWATTYFLSTMTPTPSPTPLPIPDDTWVVASGDCSIDYSSGCAMTPNYPGAYKPSHECNILVGNSLGVVTTVDFNTDAHYDVLMINGVKYHGPSYYSPPDVTPTAPISWTTDNTISTANGWKLCQASRWKTKRGYCTEDWDPAYAARQITSLGTCRARCLKYPRCAAVTYNSGSGACVFCSGITVKKDTKHRTYIRTNRPTALTTATGFDTWTVAEGACTVDSSGNCLMSPNFPSAYDNEAGCKIDIGFNIGSVSATVFDTEFGYDALIINGVRYHGTMADAPQHVTPTQPILWNADPTVAKEPGWKICREPATPAPTPNPAAANVRWIKHSKKVCKSRIKQIKASKNRCQRECQANGACAALTTGRSKLCLLCRTAQMRKANWATTFIRQAPAVTWHWKTHRKRYCSADWVSAWNSRTFLRKSDCRTLCLRNANCSAITSLRAAPSIGGHYCVLCTGTALSRRAKWATTEIYSIKRRLQDIPEDATGDSNDVDGGILGQASAPILDGQAAQMYV